MKKFLKGGIAVALSTAMTFAMAVPTFAANDADSGAMDTADTAMETPAGGTEAPIYSKNFVNVVVPTTLKVALNPEGLKVQKTSDGGDDLTSHVISLNYGIANLSDKQKNVEVSFAVADNNSGSEVLEFEDNKKDATSKTVIYSGSEAEGNVVYGTAEYGEYKVFLQAVPAKVAITETDDATAVDLTTITSGAAANVTGANLSKVACDSWSTDDAVVLIPDTTMKLQYTLPACEYDFKSGESIVLGADNDNDVSEKFEMKEVTEGAITAFTFDGEVNTYADWSKITEGIQITPTYKFTDIDGTEKIKTGTAAILVTDNAPSIETKTYTMTATDDIAITVDLGAGSLAATGIDSIKWVSGSRNDTMSSSQYTYSNGTLTITKEFNAAIIRAGLTPITVTVTFNDTAKTSVELTLSVASE